MGRFQDGLMGCSKLTAVLRAEFLIQYLIEHELKNEVFIKIKAQQFKLMII